MHERHVSLSRSTQLRRLKKSTFLMFDDWRTPVRVDETIAKGLWSIHAQLAGGRTMSLPALSKATRISIESLEDILDLGLLSNARPLPAAPTKKNPAIPSSLADVTFPPESFFAIPSEVGLHEADVAFLGLPLACPGEVESLGVDMGYHMIRQYSMFTPWLTVADKGVYSEMRMMDGPEKLGKGLAICDRGYIPFAGRSMPDVLRDLKKELGAILKAKVKPIVIGGDHAITYPLLWTWEQIDPRTIAETQIIHLDAHNDYYMFDEPEYAHGAPIFNLLEETKIKGIQTFGMRRYVDRRSTYTYELARESHLKSGRLSQFGILDTIQLAREPKALRKVLGGNKKFFLSIDIDVVSAALIEGATGDTHLRGLGLDWHELFRFISTVAEHGEIIGCDFVEYSPRGAQALSALQPIVSLLILLVELLARRKT